VEDCSFLAKIKTFKVDANLNQGTYLGIIGAKSERRLRQFKMITVLRKKFKNLMLQYPKK
jgi:hypothetical protein